MAQRTSGRPQFGTELSTVSGFTVPGYQVYLRVLAAFEAVGNTPTTTWSELAAARGLALRADTSCWDLGLDRSSDGSDGLLPAYGYWSAKHLASLAVALATATTPEEPCTWVTWDGYAGDRVLAEASRRTTKLDLGNWISPATAHEQERPLRWLASRSRENGNHIPLAGWPSSHAWVLAAPIDHDSLYISCSTELALELEHRLETMRVLRVTRVQQGY